MKKFTILLLILLYSCNENSHNNTTTTTISINSYDKEKYGLSYETTKNKKGVVEDVINTVTIPKANDKSFRWENGYKKVVDVKFLNILNDTIEKYQLEIIVPKIMMKAKYKCDNYLSYVPVELFLLNNHEGEMIAQVKYNARNKYNAESERSSAFKISKELDVEDLQ
jgi:hypothetical protein